MAVPKKRDDHPEEGNPSGLAGSLTHHFWRSTVLGKVPPPIDDILAGRDPGRSLLLTIWEPLPTRAPRPSRTKPYCCYLCTVVFYKRRRLRSNDYGHHVLGPNGGFAEWDRIETRLSWDDQVLFEGEVFACGGGSVLWRQGRWWMRRWARRDRVEAT
jgi:hypothetical protein